MAKLSLKDLQPNAKRVLVRVDFNVPLKTTDGGPTITDDTRITAALPTIKHLVENGARVILMSHLGRPDGSKKTEFSLAPVAKRLGDLLGQPVQFANDCIGDDVTALVDGLKNGEVLLLENVRFYAEEEDNNAEFAKKLAGHGEMFVNDAFGTAHRAHASTAGVTKFISQSAAGLLMEKELQYLQEELAEPKRPFLVVMGGSKVSDKILVINNLLEKADSFLIGGAMAYTFRKAQGYATGKSRVEADKLELALELLEKAKAKGVEFLLPADTRTTQEFKEGAETRSTKPYAEGGGIEDGWEGIDIGDVAIKEFVAEIGQAKTIIWNGPVGVFEIDSFAKGTKAIAEAIAEATDNGALTIIGGGDSVTAVNKFKVADRMTFISTGGGASLELLEGKELPGVAALSDRPSN